MTPEQLHDVMPFAGHRVEAFAKPLHEACLEFNITSPEREAAFIAQIAHESGELRYTREIASGQAYERRNDLGNTEPGDGPRFRGRGLLQITGRLNYGRCGTALGLDLLNHPELLELAVGACRSAGWFWQTHALNVMADRGEFELITRRINGGTNGLTERQAYYARAKAALGIA